MIHRLNENHEFKYMHRNEDHISHNLIPLVNTGILYVEPSVDYARVGNIGNDIQHSRGYVRGTAQ